jgi:hypothetical protein
VKSLSHRYLIGCVYKSLVLGSQVSPDLSPVPLDLYALIFYCHSLRYRGKSIYRTFSFEKTTQNNVYSKRTLTIRQKDRFPIFPIWKYFPFILNERYINLKHLLSLIFNLIRNECHYNFSFPPGPNELRCSLSIGGIPL